MSVNGVPAAAPSRSDRMDRTAAVQLTGAVRRYRGGRAVGPVDLGVAAGEVLALMGPNGAGKSTVLRVMATADRPDAGRATWWGRGERGWARRSIGYAADAPEEEETLSPRQATTFWCAQWIADPARARALSAEALGALGLAERADEPVGTLSYGLRRRLALAQALAHRPRLVLLDEPSAGLDPAGCGILATTLRQRAAAGAAVVVASNDPEFVAAVADRVALLHEGRCRRVAPLATLLEELPRRRVVELRFEAAGAAEGRRLSSATQAGPAGVGGDALVAGGDLAGEEDPGVGPAARRLRLVPGVVAVSEGAGKLRVELEEGASLAALVAAADAGEGGIGLRSFEVRRPDLRDAFPLLGGGEEGGPDGDSSAPSGGEGPE